MKTAAYDLMWRLSDSHWWYRARRRIVSEIIMRVVPPSGDIIDYGAGTGGTAAALKELGYKVVAADISEDTLEACRVRGLATVNLKKESLRSSSADCVLAGDVLEHVHDDVALLFSLRQALRPGGVLVVTVPAYQFLWSGEDYVSEHLRRYTRKTLLQRLDLAGFRVVWCSYFNTLLFPIIALVRITNRLLFPRAMYRSDVVALAEWKNEILSRVFECERHLLRTMRLPVGASLLAVARLAESEQRTS
jgi:SAM-dependent methyltransferase